MVVKKLILIVGLLSFISLMLLSFLTGIVLGGILLIYMLSLNAEILTTEEYINIGILMFLTIVSFLLSYWFKLLTEKYLDWIEKNKKRLFRTF
jgi:hypothetical protein